MAENHPRLKPAVGLKSGVTFAKAPAPAHSLKPLNKPTDLHAKKPPAAPSAPAKPSARLDKYKASDPFKPAKKHRTGFGNVYNAGGIPCRINHGSVRSTLSWSVDVHEVPVDPVLVLCFEGLLETEHPFVFVARQAIHDLLTLEGASAAVAPHTHKLVPSLRIALTSADKDVFCAALEALQLLSNVVGPVLNEHLPILLGKLGKHVLDRALNEKVMRALQTIEANGGPAALLAIKSKVPTYNTINLL